MKILPPHDDERVYAWIILPVCMVFLAGALALSAAFDTWGNDGIYENLFTEAVGVAAEIGLIYLIITKWIERRENARWTIARRALLMRLEVALCDQLLQASGVFEAIRDDTEEQANDLLESINRIVGRIEQDLSMMQAATDAELAAHFSSYLESMRLGADLLRQVIGFHFQQQHSLIRMMPKYAGARAKDVVRKHEYAETALFKAAQYAGVDNVPDRSEPFSTKWLLDDLRRDVEQFCDHLSDDQSNER